MLYQRIRNLWKNPKNKELKELRFERLIEWRKEGAVIRIQKPTRLDRARALGYRAKQGIILARVRVLRGGRKRRGSLKKGRRSKNATPRKIVDKSYQTIAEQRANRDFKNCEVVNSYEVGKDGRYGFYEVILVDRDHPQIKKDKQLSGLSERRGRVFRGLTNSGRRSRGILNNKGKGAEKLRPSRFANFKRKDNKQRK
ncbi:MAG: 50S ribosomal protein L15e [Nanoarchaeota archaeon]|nr:50S ribosomal protein L15e [Nanoarchaeota archaeon]|tara:strand:- start:2731 stop:3324 length:594 start_codon:yes stop_codon:yes gene_type:complete